MSHAIKIDKLPLPYWRAALAEVGLLHPEVPAESKLIAISNVDGVWRVTEADPDIASWVNAQFSASKAIKDDKTTKTIPFVLIAARLSELASHGVKQEARDVHKGLSILCVPCLLDRSGNLLPDPDRHAWIPRNLLEPTLEPVAIGDLDSYDKFISKLPSKATSFDDTLQIASKLFAAVTGAMLPSLPPVTGDNETPNIFALEGYELVCEWHGIPYDPPIVAKNLIKLYDQIAADTPSLPLLDSLRSTEDRPSRPPLTTQNAERWHTNTVGHINRKHSLSPSQREAMVELARLNVGEVLAVNGPPGTGKTTLLQSVIAQLWIDAALKEAECPLIVVASTNVKAVENVLESFAKISTETGHERWHPYQGGFGLFLASNSRESQHPICTRENHPYAEYETAEAVETAEKYFLDQATVWFKAKPLSVADAVKSLHERLVFSAQKIKEIVAARYAVYRATDQVTSDGAATSCTRLLNYYQEKIDVENLAIRTADQDLSSCIEGAKTAESEYEATRSAINHAEMAWNAYLAASPLWLDLLYFLPPIRRRRMAHDRYFLMANPLTEDRQHRDDGISEHFSALKKAALQHKSSMLLSLAERRHVVENLKTKSLEHRKAAEQAWSKINVVFQRWRRALKDNYGHMVNASLDDLNDRLDLAIRAPMFGVADWYWSGRWLLEMADRMKTGAIDKRGRSKLEAKYRRFAKLSPCLVSNFHMAPSFFTAWQGKEIPFWNAIDLLIVDEAGQVSPDIGAAMFALAKRALVVGDIYQIEPVWNNGEATDRVNAVKFNLISNPHDPIYDKLAEDGYSPASGNLMRIANRSCPVQKYDDVRGLMLTEHRRCVPELISYCNKLIYSGRLEPKRSSIEPGKRILPAFGYLSVASKDTKVGNSRRNDDEAKVIVRWLKSNRERIEEHYIDDKTGMPTPLWKVVGVVTPFKPQASAIERVLRKEMPDLMRKDSKLTVGTVHALQGAERAIVIFSPTYGESYTGGAFFDQKPNMLNVAVSRAKDSFLVFGNLALFDATKRSRPSGLLATYLLHEENSLAI